MNSDSPLDTYVRTEHELRSFELARIEPDSRRRHIDVNALVLHDAHLFAGDRTCERALVVDGRVDFTAEEVDPGKRPSAGAFGFGETEQLGAVEKDSARGNVDGNAVSLFLTHGLVADGAVAHGGPPVRRRTGSLNLNQ